MNTLRSKIGSLIIRKPLLAYFLFSYTFFWLFLALVIAALGIVGLQPDALPVWAMPIIVILGSWMPNLAAVIVTGVLEGRNGIRQLLGKFFDFRIGARWYAAALLPFLLAFAAAGFYRLIGGAAPGNSGLSIGFWASLIILNLVEGATGEEAGWRGFALPRLQKKFGPGRASLILGLLWSFWHMPLWITSGFSGTDLLVYIFAFSVSIISLTFLMTWIFNHTHKSLIPIVIIHFSLNASMNLVGTDGLGLVPSFPLLIIIAGVYLVTAVIVWGANGWSAQKKLANQVYP